MLTLSELADKTGLPWSRDERFYTGTIFPMIVCRNNFNHIRYFLQLVDPHLAELDVQATARHSNVQFLTEYNPQKAAMKDRDRFGNVDLFNDTPDIVILIHGVNGESTQIAIEAKMYDLPSSEKLQAQREAQLRSLKPLSDAIGMEPEHRLLIAEKHRQQLSQPEPKGIITWEQIIEAYEGLPEYQNDHFLGILREAVGRFDSLKASSQGGLHNTGGFYSGKEIYQHFIDGKAGFVNGFMGRQGGLDGPLQEDITSGSWRDQSYETNFEVTSTPNRNWFAISDFVKLVNKHRKK